MCSASIVFSLRRTPMWRDVRPVRSVTGCRSLQITRMSAVPSMTWTQSFGNGRSALVPVAMLHYTAWERTWRWSSLCAIRKRLVTSFLEQRAYSLMSARSDDHKGHKKGNRRLNSESGPIAELFRFFDLVFCGNGLNPSALPSRRSRHRPNCAA